MPNAHSKDNLANSKILKNDPKPTLIALCPWIQLMTKGSLAQGADNGTDRVRFIQRLTGTDHFPLVQITHRIRVEKI
jgi:hypothetical protein